MSELTGTKVGRFEVTRHLGAGGMGEVYLATDTRLKRTVVLKRLAPHLRADARYRDRLVKEAERASRLDLQHIAAIYDVIEEGGEVFIVMEHVDGADLRHAAINPQNIPEILSIAVQCAEALAAAHEVGVLHRDIKPENIMLRPDRTVKVLDFGLAREIDYSGPHADTAVTASLETKAPAGTAGYVAPEVLLEHGIDARADVFSLGVVFYELLTRRHPFRTESFVGTCDRVLHYEPPPLRQVNPQIPPELERIVHKMLAKDRGERYATVADLLVDLRSLERHGTTATSYVPASTAGLPGWAKWAVLAAAVAALAIIGWKQRGKPAEEFAGGGLPAQKHVAVLPFQFIGGSAEQEVLAQGLAVTLSGKLTRLTANHKIQVAPASEVRAKKITTADEARRELGVNLVLTASMVPWGDGRTRVTLEAVNTSTNRSVGSEEFTVAAGDLFGMEDRLVTAVVQMLGLSVAAGDEQVLRSFGTSASSAYELYQTGRGHLQDYENPEKVTLALQAFDEALRLDPNYALAHAARGEALWQRYVASREVRWVGAAKEACNRAASLNADLAAAQICLGTLASGTGQEAEAVRHFERAVQLEPTSDAGYRGLAKAYERLGKMNEAEATYRRAIEIRPHYWAGHSWLGQFLTSRARYEEAVQAYTRALELSPDNALAASSLGGVFYYMGRYPQAVTMLEKSISIRPTAEAYSNLGNALMAEGRAQDAVKAFEQSVRLGKLNHSSEWNMARAYQYGGRAREAQEIHLRLVERGKERLRVNPHDTDVHVLMAYSYAALKRSGDAQRHLQAALRLQPENPEYRFFAGLVHSQLGTPSAALAELQAAVKRGYSVHDISHAPEFEGLRSDPRFQAMVQAPGK